MKEETKKKTMQTLKDMTKYIAKYQITDIAEFKLYCLTQNAEWFYVLGRHELYFHELIMSVRRKKRRQQMV